MKKLKDTLVLWLAGFGIPADPIFADNRVKFELEQREVDPVGLLRAIQTASYSIRNLKSEDRQNLFKPQVQLELLSLVQGGGESFTPFADIFA